MSDLRVATTQGVVAVAVCILANYFAAVAVFDSRWGSAFMMDDNFHNISITISMLDARCSMLVGLVLGLVESIAFRPRIAMTAAAIGLVGVLTILLAFTLVTQGVGIAVGCALVWTIRRCWAGIC